jgi:hypothetical protein
MNRLNPVLLAGFVLALAACSSSVDNPPMAVGSGGRGNTSGTGAGLSSGATGAAGEAAGGNLDQPSGGNAGGLGGQSAATGGSAVGTGGANAGGSSSASGGSNTAGATSQTGGAGGACANESSQTTSVPPVLEFVIDVTGSMADQPAYPNDPTNTASKWQVMQGVLPGVFQSFPADWAVGVSYFRKPDTGCFVPDQSVAIDVLTATQQTAIGASIARRGPKGNTTAADNVQGATPTLAAWRFGLTQLTGWSNGAYANSERSIVLVTDGVPTVNADGCTYVNPITQAEYNSEITTVQTEGQAAHVKTYVIGVLGSENPQNATYDPMYMLSLWAIAGGTGQAGCTPVSGTPSGNTTNPRGTYCHFDLTTNPDFATGLVAALQQIATGQISCTYQVPPPPADGRIFDLQNITVTYSPSSGGPRTLGKAPSSSCVGGQWYVSQTDANGNPATLELCADTCAAAQGDPGATVEVTFTCLYRQ